MRTLLLAAALASAAGAASAMSGRDFLSQALKGDNAEIAMGTLVENQGAGVKTYGRTLATIPVTGSRPSRSSAR